MSTFHYIELNREECILGIEIVIRFMTFYGNHIEGIDNYIIKLSGASDFRRKYLISRKH